MKELKTLKDIGEKQELQVLGSTKKFKTPRMIYEDELRQVAQNWIDYLQECKDGNHSNDNSTNFKMVYKAEKWIKHFFNLEEK